jgi:hypothetical protein
VSSVSLTQTWNVGGGGKGSIEMCDLASFLPYGCCHN